MIVLETPAFQEEIEIYKSEILVAHKEKDRITKRGGHLRRMDGYGDGCGRQIGRS